MEFCPNCGANNAGTSFCPDCGYAYSQSAQSNSDVSDVQASDWLKYPTLAPLSEQARIARQPNKDLEAFEYEKHQNGKYMILALKNKMEMVVTVPEGVESIGPGAFEGSEIMKVILPEGLIKIGNRAFADCVELNVMNLPGSLTIIGQEAFAGCQRLDITPPEQVRVGKDAFKGTLPEQRKAAEEAERERKAKEAERKRKAKEAERKRKEEDARLRIEEEDRRRKEEEDQKRLEKYQPGKYITLGHYPQSGSFNEEIEWLILEKKDNRILVISRYALDCVRYNEKSRMVTWRWCTLRKWLNNVFLKVAFDANERARIPKVRVTADKNPEYSTYPGGATYDKIFLLSITEMRRYFSSIGAKCYPTTRARDKCRNIALRKRSGVDDIWGWWLRSPGSRQSSAAIVSTAGKVEEDGYYVDHDHYAVRPAMWINLDD